MGKRSDGDFKRNARDHYRTPAEAVLPLTPFLARGVDSFAEPFVGDGAIVAALVERGHTLAYACDIKPLRKARAYAETRNALTLTKDDLRGASVIITNTPWPAKHGQGEPTLGFIRHLITLAPSWFLLSADFKHNGYAADLLWNHCATVVSVGRVKWIAGSKNSGVDNAAWYYFDGRKEPGPPAFHPIQRPLPREAAENSLEALI